jgi:membrane protease YdiL (CAAX protease family)
MKSKVYALLEVLFVFALIQTLLQLYRLTDFWNWELQTLGWSYIGMAILIGIPALAIWLPHRNWVDYGVSSARWPTNLDIGIKAFLIGMIPLLVGQYVPAMLGLGSQSVASGAFAAVMEIAAIALIIWVMNRQKPVRSGRRNLITIGILLLIPILLALFMGRLSLVIISTIVWQFLLSGFGEEFVCRGYYQSRLNQAFGRPFYLSGIQFGVGLIIASMLFGLLHAFNGYDPAVGFASFDWGWGLWTFMGGLFFGVIREKTGTLLAPGVAHGLPDAVGEPMKFLFSWM